MIRAAWIGLVMALTLGMSACSGAGGKAEPARVELDWPDAGVVKAPEASKTDVPVVDAAPASSDGSE